jgi:hypothetical protein
MCSVDTVQQEHPQALPADRRANLKSAAAQHAVLLLFIILQLPVIW